MATAAIPKKHRRAPLRGNHTHLAAPDLVRVADNIVNAYLIGAQAARSGEWVIVDTGVSKGVARSIVKAAAERFGPASRPHAIILTHGHFDHVGSVRELARYWDVPVFAHPREMPYLSGGDAYPPPDPSVGGGLMARLSSAYPRGPIDLGGRLQALPDYGEVPGLPGWQWLPTPGHTAGHISLFRERDRVLVAGDAFVTVKQESATAVLSQHQKVHGPPAYYTSDWIAAWESVRRLAALQPELAATGHGFPMHGRHLREQLDRLARDFDREAVPMSGRYIRFPAIADEEGVHWIPPRPVRPRRKLIAGLAVAAVAGITLAAVTSGVKFRFAWRALRAGRRVKRRLASTLGSS